MSTGKAVFETFPNLTNKSHLELPRVELERLLQI